MQDHPSLPLHMQLYNVVKRSITAFIFTCRLTRASTPDQVHEGGVCLSERKRQHQLVCGSCWCVRMQLTPFCLTLSCLRVVPDRAQFFRYDSVSLICEGQVNATGWKVRRRTPEGGVSTCSFGWGTTTSGSTCIIKNIYPIDGGVYWCESGDKQTSNGVNITITDRTVKLESPALPVSEGTSVTLRCKAETTSPNHTFHFHKDDRLIRSDATGELTIQSISKADEGLYKCISGAEESFASWLAVEASLPPSTSAPPAVTSSVSLLRLIFHLVVGTPYLLVTVLLGLIYRDKRRAAQTDADRRGSNDVIMEIVEYSDNVSATSPHEPRPQDVPQVV